MRPDVMRRGALFTSVLLLAGLAPLAALPSQAGAPWPPFTVHETYEVGGVGDGVALRIYDASGEVASDGNFDIGGIIFDGCRSIHHVDNGGRPNRDLPCGMGEEDSLSLDLNDQVFGLDVGGFLCLDTDGNLLCGEDHEFATAFCAISPTISVDISQAHSVVVLIDGPAHQPVDCPGTANPAGGTVGDLWMTVAIDAGDPPTDRRCPETGVLNLKISRCPVVHLVVEDIL